MRVRHLTKSILSIFVALTLSASCSSDPKEQEEVVEATNEFDEEEVELDDLASIEDAENEAMDIASEESGVEMAGEAEEEIEVESYDLEEVADEDDAGLGDEEIAEEFEGEGMNEEEMADEGMNENAVEVADSENDTVDTKIQGTEELYVEDEDAIANVSSDTNVDTKSELGSGEPVNSNGASKSYIVRPGDSLTKISKIIYGDDSRWKELAAWNEINNPAKIFPGDTISYEEDTDSSRSFATASKKSTRTVTVKTGDSLSKIAHKVFGDAGAWKYLWKMNDSISNPDKIFAGQKLTFLDPVELASMEINGGSKVGQN